MRERSSSSGAIANIMYDRIGQINTTCPARTKFHSSTQQLPQEKRAFDVTVSEFWFKFSMRPEKKDTASTVDIAYKFFKAGKPGHGCLCWNSFCCEGLRASPEAQKTYRLQSTLNCVTEVIRPLIFIYDRELLRN